MPISSLESIEFSGSLLVENVIVNNIVTVTGSVGLAASPVVSAVYDAAPAARADGGSGHLQTDSAGSLLTSEATLISGEDQTNNVMQGVRKPLAVSTYAWSLDDSAAYEASTVTKATPGTLRSVTGYNSGAGQFIQVHNKTSLPADAQVPVVIFWVPAQSNFSFDFGEDGRWFSVGIVVCNSSTGPTKTIGAANLWLNIRYL